MSTSTAFGSLSETASTKWLGELVAGLPEGAAVVYNDRLSGVNVVTLHPLPGNAAWDMGDIDIPAGVPVVIRAEAPMGVRLNYIGQRGYMFLVKAGWRSVTFENLIFVGGGIAYEGGVRRSQTVRDCVFQDIVTGPAIQTLGASVIDVEIARCWFNRCAGGVWNLYNASDIWVIRHCIFNRNTDTDVIIKSSGVTVRNCNFETRATNYDKPYILSSYGLDVNIVENRFGPEVDTGVGPPQYAITIGETGAGQETGTVGPHYIAGNSFFGMNPFGTTSATQAKAAIHLSKGTFGSRVIGNFFRKYDTAHVHENYASASSRDNVFQGNVKDSLGSVGNTANNTPNFSGANTGWTVS